VVATVLGLGDKFKKNFALTKYGFLAAAPWYQ
jgi:hypothetical protein